ncbi:MAG: pilus assembly PilX N-terminal domain-containing protein [Betaproteobacteria bacterium]
MLLRPSRGKVGAGGFAIVSAIFLLVILSALAAFIVQISTQQQMGATADIQGVRAYQAARAGVEWGAFNHIRNSACAATSSFTLGGNLTGFTVTVQCQGAVSNDENGTALVIRRVVATACNQPSGAAPGVCPNPAPGANYIEREIAVVAGR